MSQTQLKSGAEANKKKLSGMVDVDEEEDFNALGIVTWSTTGEILVPSSWLEEKWEEYDLPEDLFPSDVWPSSVFKRTVSYLEDHELEEKTIKGHKLKFRFEEGDGYIRHLYADTYFTEEEIGEDGGAWKSRKLGFFDYNATEQKLEYYTEIEGEELEKEWNKIVGKAQGLYEKIGNCYNGLDLSQVIRDVVNEHTKAVPLRTAGVNYFLPAKYADMMDGFAEVWDQMNQFKDNGGKRTEIVTLPVIDSKSHRNLVKTHAEEMINSKIESVIEKFMKLMTEDREEDIEDIAESVVEELSSVSQISEEYSALLEVELSVKRELKRHIRNIEGEKEALIKEVIDGL